MSDVTMLATGLGFPEGPVVCHDGSVVLTEIRHGRCTRVTPDGRTSVFSHTGGGPWTRTQPLRIPAPNAPQSPPPDSTRPSYTTGTPGWAS